MADEDERPTGWLARLTDRPNAMADRYARSHGAIAREVMTARVVTVAPDASANHVAHLMEQHGIRRVLVVERGRLLGMVTRTDLLRALMAGRPPDGEVSDERIRGAILAAMQRESGPTRSTSRGCARGRGGVLRVHRSASVQRALRVLAENVPGVKRVVDNTQQLHTLLES